jgi:hypothetical protein
MRHFPGTCNCKHNNLLCRRDGEQWAGPHKRRLLCDVLWRVQFVRWDKRLDADYELSARSKSIVLRPLFWIHLLRWGIPSYECGLFRTGLALRHRRLDTNYQLSSDWHGYLGSYFLCSIFRIHPLRRWKGPGRTSTRFRYRFRRSVLCAAVIIWNRYLDSYHELSRSG